MDAEKFANLRGKTWIVEQGVGDDMAEKILVVDDDLDTLKLVGMMLERQGFNILAASNGQQALNLARSEKPDLIILDLMMPDIDGIQVARQLRSDPTTQNILILMFTAKSQLDEKVEGFDAGADDYLTKPIQPRELIAHVRAVLKRSGEVRVAPARSNRERGALIGVIAPKGGVGVSTLTVNAAIALQKASKKSVVVADFRPGGGTIGLELGLSDSQGLNHLLALAPEAITPEAIEAELVEHPSGVRFLLASSDPGDARSIIESDHFAAISQNIAYTARYTVIDLGPGLTPVNQKVIEDCQHIILVLEPVGQTIAQARTMYDRLVGNRHGEEAITLVLINRQRAGMQLSLGQAQDLFGRTIPVIVTAAPELAYQAQVSNTPMILRQPDGVTTQQFASLVQKVLQLVH
jgi:pilus assembly protein CpaE